MVQYRIATVEERREFYDTQFQLMKMKEWLGKWPQFFAVDYGSETKQSVDPTKLNQIVILPPNLDETQLRGKLVEYAPEDVYADVNRYKDTKDCYTCEKHKPFCSNCENVLGKTLVFDVDPENIDCPKCGKKEYPKFCNVCMRMSLQKGVELAHFLETRHHFEQIRFVFSGRGCHIHVDDDAAFRMTLKERQELAKNLQEFCIDPWVTTEKHLIRAPYTLNALVSRIAIPLELDEVSHFDPETDSRTIPEFLT